MKPKLTFIICVISTLIVAGVANAASPESSAGIGTSYLVPLFSPQLGSPLPSAIKTTPLLVVEHTSPIIPRSDDLRNDDEIVFRHGDISWLPELAIEAGWEPEHLEKLGQIILRESGGCPNRRGGDAVDKNCNITHVTEWNHRSDSGLTQINGVNYDSKRIGRPAFLCKKMNICEQEPLLDPLTNLKAGKALYDAVGWSPWDPQPKKPKKP